MRKGPKKTLERPPALEAQPLPPASYHSLPLCRETVTDPVTHSSPGSSLWRKRPEECMGGTPYGQTSGRSWSPGRKNRRTEITIAGKSAISRVCGCLVSGRGKGGEGLGCTGSQLSWPCRDTSSSLVAGQGQTQRVLCASADTRSWDRLSGVIC